jgi:transposase-like protein
MIIWGFRWRDKTLSSGSFFCPHCNANRSYKLKRPGYYFSLFFLPILRVWKRKPFVECQVCSSRFDPQILTTESQGTLQLVASTRYALLHGVTPLDARSHLVAQGIDGAMADRLIEMAQR